MLLDCANFRKMVRNNRRVAPVEENVGVYTIPMEYSSSSGHVDYEPRAIDYKRSQFDSDLNLIETSYKTPCTEEEQRKLRTDNDNMKSRGRSFMYYLVVDLPILLTVVALTLCLELGYIPFHRSGYYCKDESINFPFIKDTVSMSFLVVSAIVLPLVVMWPVEYVLYRPNDYSIKSKRWLESLKASSLWYREYFYGLVINFLVIEVMKMTMGNPRPTFLDICKPDNMNNCTKGEYVDKFTCTSSPGEYSNWFTLDSSRSFPSGHTSFSVNTGLFLAWYLQRRAFSWHNRTVLLVPLLQLLCVAYAVVCSFTRITDHRHHWWDVLAGFFVGVLTAIYSVLILCHNFACPSTSSTSDISSSDSSGHNNHPSVRRLLSSGSAGHALPHAHIAHMP